MEQNQIKTTRELQEIALEGLRILKRVCDQYNIRYAIAGGTLLGAVRHQGFIPWDDDIDILMLREDYENLKKLPTDAFGPNWRLYSYDNTDGYDNIFMKLCCLRTEKRPSPFESGLKYGISVDLFPFDSLAVESDDEAHAYAAKIRKKLRMIERIYRTLISNRKGTLGGIARFVFHIQYKIIRKFCSLPKAYARLEKQTMSTNPDTKYLICFCDVYRKIWKRADIIDPVSGTTMLPFEGDLYCAPYQYDKILKEKYGDYMQLPPVEKRVTDHVFKAYYV